MSSSAFVYEGSELEIFEHAANWKRYWSDAIWAAARSRSGHIDVIELIKASCAEVAEVTKRLRSGGVPIAQGSIDECLFGAFAKSTVYFRCYPAADLRAVTHPELEIVSAQQLDCVGTLASIVDQFALTQEIPNVSQIKPWDRLIVTISRLLDPLTFYRIGESAVATWRRC
jgi:hypothetical protein